MEWKKKKKKKESNNEIKLDVPWKINEKLVLRMHVHCGEKSQGWNTAVHRETIY